MRVPSVHFLLSAMSPDQFPRDRRPEVAFVGRSNVGKSSLLNALFNRRELAKTSGTPGKTQTVNFFDIGGRFYFVDLPGYGFAKVPLAVKEKWGQVMLAYLSQREPLCLAVQLLDARRKPTPKDIEMLGLLEEAEVPTLIVVTKVDKLTRMQRSQVLAELRKALGLDESAVMIPFSAVTGEGKQSLWDTILEQVNS